MGKKQKLPIILQSELAECGLACITMILGYHGCTLSLSDVRRHIKTTLKGMTLQQLKLVAESFDLAVKVLRIDLAQLNTIKLPCIIHWDLNHFIVIKKIKKNIIYIHDPARGIRSINMGELDQSFTGIVLELEPKDNFKPFACNMNRLHVFFPLIKVYRFTMCKLLFYSFLIQICYICGIKVIQLCIDSSASNIQYQFISILLIALLGIKTIEISAAALRTLTINCLGVLINQEFGTLVMKHLITLPVSFFENRHIGDVISRFGAIEKIKASVTEGLVEGFVDGFVSIITLIAMCMTSFRMSIIVLISSSLYFLSRLYYNKKAKTCHEESLYMRASELSYLMETIRAISSIKIFSRESERVLGWMNKFISSLNAMTRIVWHKTIYDSGKGLLHGIDLVLISVISCLLISDHKMSLGMFYAFMTFRQQFMIAVSSLVDKIQDYRLLKLHLNRLDDIVSESPELKPITTICTHDKEFPKGILQLDNISFTHSIGEKPVIHQLSLCIKAGECVAITGPSGCGKTTLLKIMMGLLPPTNGTIRINHTEIYPDHVACFRKRIAAVLQNDILLSGSIEQNISFFDQAKDSDYVLHCAKLAGILDEIKAFPMGFGTLIGDMGSVLSGGQKQRILLARAFYARPSILFLDEASSHLDAKKEIEINQAIRSLGITTVMIAHRKETIMIADRVITL